MFFHWKLNVDMKFVTVINRVYVGSYRIVFNWEAKFPKYNIQTFEIISNTVTSHHGLWMHILPFASEAKTYFLYNLITNTLANFDTLVNKWSLEHRWKHTTKNMNILTRHWPEYQLDIRVLIQKIYIKISCARNNKHGQCLRPKRR